MLVGAEGAGLFEETVHERGLAVVNVRDDRDVSDVLHIVNDRVTHNLMVSDALIFLPGNTGRKPAVRCDGLSRAA